MSKYTTTIYEILASEGYKHGFNDFIAPDGIHLITYGDNLAFINKVNAFDSDIQNWANNALFAGNRLTSAGADYFFKKEFVSLFINREIKYQTLDLWRIKLTAEMTKYDQWLSNTYDSFYKIYTNEQDGKTTGNLLANQVNTSNTDFTGKVTSNSHTETTSNTNSNTDTSNTTRHRDLDATLPQNETSLNLDSDNVSYADSRKDSKDKSAGNTKQTSNTVGTSNTNSVTDTKNVTDTTANQDTKQDTTGTSFDINFDIDTVNKIYRVYNPIFNELDRKLFLQIW